MRIVLIVPVLLLVFVATAFAGGDHGDGDTPSVAVTQWTDHMELFMEYPVLVAGEPGRFIIHLTVLNGQVDVLQRLDAAETQRDVL